MPARHAPDRSISELLAGLRLAGRTWCYADLAGAAGVAVAPGDAVFIHVVIHGHVRIACASGAHAELGPGDAVAVLSGEAHALRTVAEAPAEPFAFLRSAGEADVPPAFAFGNGRVVARVLSGRLAATWPADGARSALPALLRLDGDDAPLRPGAFARAGVGGGAAVLLTRLAEALVVAALRRDPGCRGFLTRQSADPIVEAVKLVAGAPSHPWTVESLARSVGMGRSNFAAQFSQRLGKAPMEVVAEHRMEQAAVLLEEGRLKLAEIAELAGYGSEAAFSRRFSRHFGTTPSRHREAARQEREHQPVPAPGFRPLLGPAPPPITNVETPPAAPRKPSNSDRRLGVLLREPRD